MKSPYFGKGRWVSKVTSNIVDDFKDRSIKSLLSWAKRFIKRMGFCYRNVTKAKTNIKEDIID